MNNLNTEINTESLSIVESSVKHTMELPSFDEAQIMLDQFTSVSDFFDTNWFIDKKEINKNIPRYLRNINFKPFWGETAATVKMWVLRSLILDQTIETIQGKLNRITSFRNCFDEIISFSYIDKQEIMEFYEAVFDDVETDSNLKWAISKWNTVKYFFQEMGYQYQYKIMNKYVIPKTPDITRNEEKYIPEEVIAQIDPFMMNGTIPNMIRCIYWILRLIPSRISEVLSMKRNCLKQLTESSYVLTIPIYKETVPYMSKELKLIEIESKGMGEFLIGLIQEAINETRDLPADDFLFYSKAYYSKITNPSKELKYYLMPKSHRSLITRDRYGSILRRICSVLDVRYDGKPYLITSHQYRHNGISDRLNSGIFRLIDVQRLTYHHIPETVYDSYCYTSSKDMRKHMKKEQPVIFRGRVINTDNPLHINRLLSRPYACRIHNLGICSDTRDCDADMAACLRCKYLVPDFENIDYYSEELSNWKKKKQTAEDCNNSDYAALCEDWIKAYSTVIERVLSALSDEKLAL